MIFLRDCVLDSNAGWQTCDRPYKQCVAVRCFPASRGLSRRDSVQSNKARALQALTETGFKNR